MLLWTVIALLVLAIAAVIALLTVPAPVERWLQARVLLALREHYGANVQLENLHVRLIPALHMEADNFVLPNRRGSDVPPLITVKHLEVSAALPQLLRTPLHISNVKLEGMVITVPPSKPKPPAVQPAASQNASPQAPVAALPASPSAEATAPATGAGSPATNPSGGKVKRQLRWAHFVINKVQADGTRLVILRHDPNAEPLEFTLTKLALRSAGPHRPMNYVSELTNPKPPGLIQTSGTFGPWDFDEPSDTPLTGKYDFEHADLSVFNGISGILSSRGSFKGVLHNIVVDGTTDTPDFQLDRGAREVHLTTEFHAIVDGTNGNTYLQPVNAHFLNSNVITNGEVAGKPGVKGKFITLDVDVENSRLEDMLELASHSDTPALRGKIVFRGHILLPPGKDTVLHKLVLNGNFQVTDATFTSDKVNHAITEISRRGQGKPNDPSIQNPPAAFSGDFLLKNSRLDFSKLRFTVPGALADMKGSYGVKSGELNFAGAVEMQATLSQMVTGKKKGLLIALDPLFNRHGAGTYLPVEIAGTRQDPQVKVDWKKLF